MLHTDATGLLAGAVALGFVHGIEPGHGWPVAASYALDQTNKWVYGFAASTIIGVGHLVSSIAMVAVFFYAKSYFSLTEINEPLSIDLFVSTVDIGGPVSVVAGVLLIALGIREYTHGHSHGTDGHHDDEKHEHDHDSHSHDDDHPDHQYGHASHQHGHDHDHQDSHGHDGTDGGLLGRVKGLVPFGGGHSHSHGSLDEAADRGLFGIAWFAFLLGFAHEEEFEIISLCAGSTHCLELMAAYALTVIVGIVGLTMLLIAGYEHFEERVEQYTPYLPAFSAAVLIIIGVGFIVGLL